jgi:hypothetical protein
MKKLLAALEQVLWYLMQMVQLFLVISSENIQAIQLKNVKCQ